MTRFTKVMMAATALSMMTGVAFAQSNEAQIDQVGTGNSVAITQSGSDNAAGNATLRMLQTNTRTSGQGHRLTITQTGNENSVGETAVGTTSNGVRQVGNNSHSASITQSSNNTVGSIEQIGVGSFSSSPTNVLTINQGTATTGGNSIGTVYQNQVNGKNANTATIVQSGSDNAISRVFQTAGSNGGSHPAEWRNVVDVTLSGDRNGGSLLTGYAAASGATSSAIIQGTFNSAGFRNVASISISGDDNAFGVTQNGSNNSIGVVTITGSDNQLGIFQQGELQGNVANVFSNRATISTIEGSNNNIGIRQVGLAAGGVGNTLTLNVLRSDSNGNDVNVSSTGVNDVAINIGTVGGSSDNDITVTQDGFNSAAVEIEAGNSNSFDIQQSGGETADNSADVFISGSFNGAGTFTAGGASAALGLTAGVISQAGSGNTVNLSIGDNTVPSNNNLVALAQTGATNSISSVIDGSNNQIAIAQTGNSNSAATTQTGSFNVIGISQ